MTTEVKALAATGLATILILGGAIFFFSKDAPSEKSQSQKIDSNLLVKKDSYQTSTQSAKVTIVEFGDYQCPACKQAHPMVKLLLDTYKTDINFVFRNFPLSQHKNAKIAASAAESAGKQNKFWEMHDKIYESQAEWENSENPLEIFKKYAEQLELDVTEFEKNITSNAFSEKIAADQNDGIMAGVNSTPTFFINGEKLQSSATFTTFTQKIDSLLK